MPDNIVPALPPPAASKNVSFYDAFNRSTRPIYCKNRCVTQNLSFYDAFSRSTRPIHCKNQCVTPHGRKNVSLYFAFLRLTWPIPGKGCASRRKCVILRRVQSLDQANQSIVKIDAWRLTVGKMCNFTSRFCGCRSTRPIHCKNRCVTQNLSFYDAFSRSTRPIHCKNQCVTPHGRKNVSLYFAFLRLTWPIPGKGCASRRKCVILRRVQSLDQANPL